MIMITSFIFYFYSFINLQFKKEITFRIYKKVTIKSKKLIYICYFLKVLNDLKLLLPKSVFEKMFLAIE